MSEVIQEYGAMILASVSTFTFITMIGLLLFSNGGLLAEIIFLWGNGGC